MTATTSEIPVLLVHGWAGSAEAWRPITKRLAGGALAPVPVRLPGSPGDGGSDAWTVDAGAERVVRLLEELAVPSLLVGHSMGAQVTLLAHQRAPRYVLGEVVVDPAYGAADASRVEMDEWAARIDREGHSAVQSFFASALTGLRAEDREQILGDLDRTPATVIAAYLRSEYVADDAIGLRTATSLAASGRTRPVLAIHSTQSGADHEAGLAAPGGSRIDVRLGRGHFLHLEEPDAFVEMLHQWAATLEVGSAESRTSTVA